MEAQSMLGNFPRSRYFDEGRVDLRVKDPEKIQSYRISKLWDIHMEIARRVALGEKNKAIADALGISVATVEYTKNSKVAQERIDILRGAMDADTIDLGREIQEFAPTALRLLKEVIKGEGAGKDASIALRTKTAENHMNRAGYSPVKKVAMATHHVTREEIEEIKQRSRAAAEEAGMLGEVIDVTPEAA